MVGLSWAFVLLSAADVWTTALGLSRGWGDVSLAVAAGGLVGLVVAKVVVAGVVAGLWRWRAWAGRAVLWGTVVATAGAVGWNGAHLWPAAGVLAVVAR